MKINKIDLLIIIIIFLFISIIFFGLSSNNNINESKASIAVKISQNVKVIRDEVEDSINEEVYMNGLREPITLKSYTIENGELILTFEDTGYEKDGIYIFNGQRVLAGQKIELHGKFWAQGIITEINYESN